MNKEFVTVINCMDGRVQEPVITYMKRKYNAAYVDMITEPGPNRILAENSDTNTLNSIHNRIHISVDHHHSKVIAVVGHYDCAGNPMPKDIQNEHTKTSVKYLASRFPNVEVIGLWIDEHWKVFEINKN